MIGMLRKVPIDRAATEAVDASRRCPASGNRKGEGHQADSAGERGPGLLAHLA